MGNSAQDQINALLGDVTDETIEEGSGETDQPSEDTGSEVSTETEESTEVESDEEDSSAEGETSDDQEEGSNDDETEEVDSEEESSSEIAELKTQVAELTKLVTAKSAEESKSEPPSVPEPDPISVDKLFDESFDFDSVIESEESFKGFISNLASAVQRQTHESILQSLPDTVGKYVDQTVEVKSQADKFYRDNPDLAETKPYVAQVANKVSSENPDLNFDDVLKETATRVRKALGLKEQAKKTEKTSSSQKKSPALAKGTKGQSSKKKPKQELSQMEQEIIDLMEE